MIRIIVIFLCLVQIMVLNSCLVKAQRVIKNPCQSEELINDIKNYSKAELAALKKSLESNSYDDEKDSGCRAALLGSIYFTQERMSAASDYFSKAAKKLPEFRNYFLLAKAHAQTARHDYVQAKNIATALLNSPGSLNSQFALRVRKVLADIAVQTKDNHQIIKTHQDLLAKGYLENEIILFNLAAALSKVSDHKRANEVYKKLLINFPVSPGARRAQQLQDLAHYNLELKEIEKRFDKLIEKLAFDQILKDADVLLKDPASSLNREDKSHIEALTVKSMLLNNRFEAGIARAHKNAVRPNATAEDFESYAWALAKVGRFFEASDYYGKFIARTDDREAQGRGCFFKGFSLYEASLYSMALFSWQSCHASVKGTTQYENFLWYQALASLLNSTPAKAQVPLKDLLAYFPQSPDREKYVFFLGYASYALNHKNDGDKHLQSLARQKQPSYYVLLAKKFLKNTKAHGQKIAPDALSQIAKTTNNRALKNAMLLSHLGFKDGARDTVLQSDGTAREKIAALQHLGFYHDAWQRSYMLNPTTKIEETTFSTTPTIRATFPLPHREVVDEICARYDINKNLLYAIIRTESGFSEQAVSNRGAMGLMQIMPFVAHDLAASVPMTLTDELLKTPRVSIELGARLIASLKRQFGEPHLMVAAYNAGSHQVQKWFDNFGYLPIELFVERIPFKQTRDYIKRVLHSESLYHAMNGEELRLLL